MSDIWGAIRAHPHLGRPGGDGDPTDGIGGPCPSLAAGHCRSAAVEALSAGPASGSRTHCELGSRSPSRSGHAEGVGPRRRA